MESIIKKVINNKIDDETKRYFLRFGKGNYRKRFLISLSKGKNIKVKSSFELANDFVKFISELKDVKFSGVILSKDKISGKTGRKKAGVIVYELENESIKDYTNVYYYLLNVEESDFKLRIKKALPKPGKEADKIDDAFCLMELDNKYWDKVKNAFFWDLPDCNKAIISHEIEVNDVLFPKDEKDPVKIREKAIRKGKLRRIMEIDGNAKTSEFNLSV